MAGDLASQVYQQGQAVAGNAGNALGDALGAYKFSQDVQAQRQDLQIKQDAHKQAMADGLVKTLANVDQLPEYVQKAAMEGLAPTLKSYGVGPEAIKALIDNGELRADTFGKLLPALKDMDFSNPDTAKQMSVIFNDPGSMAKFSEQAMQRGTQESVAKITGGLTQQRLAQGDKRIDISENRLNQTTHARYVSRIKDALKPGNIMGQRLIQIENLQNTLSILANINELTPETARPLQALIKQNLGIKGEGTGAERELSQINPLAWQIQSLKEFVTSKPEDIGRNSPLMKNLKQEARIEIGNATKQFDAALNFAGGGGLASFYHKQGNEDFYDDMRSLIKAGTELATPPVTAAPVRKAIGKAPPPKQAGVDMAGLSRAVAGELAAGKSADEIKARLFKSVRGITPGQVNTLLKGK